MKTNRCQIAFVLLIGLFAFASVSCVSTPEAGSTKPASTGSADHKPSYDYWQNGGGACCPAHAGMFEGS